VTTKITERANGREAETRNDIVTISIRIEGTTPLLCNRFTDAAALKATSGAGVSMVGDRGTPREIAGAKLYTSAQDGVLVIPQPNILRAIIDAGKFFKAGKEKVTTQKSSLIPACVEMNEVEYPIIFSEPWTVDTRSVRIPSTGGRILAHRPCFHDWALEFSAVLDATIIGVRVFRDLVDAAGKRIGLGDFRPACKGPFGKFVVTRWDVED